ncbi:oxidoreductase [Daedalea quercina L-15889]|uniref:Oxidoreductase n=1 Tax=Daedalea quercina L-15889 TaxID=1314783 RepID=A0A165MT28_9APHY|nr:oxidoreductase [Daedalea quercina L-15889]
MTIRLGFVGLSSQGWASQMLAPSLLQAPLNSAYTLAAVSTSNANSAAASAEEYSELTRHSVKPYHGSTAGIAADPELDFIAVAVKTPEHKTAVLPIIEAGKNFFIEWPAGKSLQETTEIADAARKKGLKTMVGTQCRQSRAIQKIKSIVESGDIGRVLSTTFVGRAPNPPLHVWGPKISERGTFTADAEQGTTLLDVIGGHFLEGFTHALGPFTSVSATLAVQYPTAELVDAAGNPTGKIIPQTGANQIAFTGTLANGAVASVHWRGGVSADGGKAGSPLLWVIDGEIGSIRIESDEPAGAYIHIYEPDLYLNGEKVELPQEGLTNPGRAWAEFAKGDTGNFPTLEDAVKLKQLLEAIKTSSRDGKRVDL